MTETKEATEKTLRGAAPRKPLSLKRTVDAGHVKQSFSHGRSKSVVVEKKKKRTISAPGGADAETAEVEEAERLLAEVMQRPGGLSTDELDARRRALEAAKERAEAEAPSARAWRRCARRSPSPKPRKRRPSRPRRAAEPQAERSSRRCRRTGRRWRQRARTAEKAKARRGPAPRRADRQARARALEVEAEAEEESRAKKKGAKPPKSPVKTGDERRERIKLTINNAFDEAQRERSLASLKPPARAREAAPGRRRAAARQGHARGDHPRGDHHPGARQPHDGALRRRHQAPDGAGRDAQDQRRHRRRHRRAHRARVRPHAQARVGGRRRGRLHRRDRCRGKPGATRAGRHHHGSRRPRQDLAARRHPPHRRRRRRGRRHHAAHRRLSGDDAQRPEDHVHRYAGPRGVHGHAPARRQGRPTSSCWWSPPTTA